MAPADRSLDIVSDNEARTANAFWVSVAQSVAASARTKALISVTSFEIRSSRDAERADPMRQWKTKADVKHAVSERNEEGKARPLKARTSTPRTRASGSVFATLDLHARASASVAPRPSAHLSVCFTEGLVRLTDERTDGRGRGASSPSQPTTTKTVMRFSWPTCCLHTSHSHVASRLPARLPAHLPARLPARLLPSQSHPTMTKKVRANLFSGFRSLHGNNLACTTTTSVVM